VSQEIRKFGAHHIQNGVQMFLIPQFWADFSNSSYGDRDNVK
jgi:hypothetical protein